MLIYHLLTQASIPGVNYPLILSLCKTRLFYSLWPQSSPSSSDLNLIELYPCRYTFGKPVTGKVSINMNLVGIGYYDNYIGNNVYLFGEVRFLLSEDLLNSCHDIHQTLNKHWTGCWYLSVLAAWLCYSTNLCLWLHQYHIPEGRIMLLKWWMSSGQSVNCWFFFNINIHSSNDMER